MALVVWFVMTVVGLLGLRTFSRTDEWAVVFRFGRTCRERIRGPWDEGAQALGGPQLMLGSRVFILSIPMVERIQRVDGELLDAWRDMRKTLPRGVVIDRPKRQGSGLWTARAHGWDEDSVDPYTLDVEGRGVSEAAALRDLEAQLWEAMSDE